MIRVLTYFVFLLTQISILAQNKTHVLITGVGDYPSNSGWNKLSSHNDLELIRKTLVGFGIPSSHITIKKDEDISHDNLLQYIQEHLLQRVNEGDFAFFHFSGHGQQINDRSGDEIDGLDEALVPFNSPKYFNKGIYEGENLITDDELSIQFSAIRKKLGPNGRLLISIDACHSGSSLRGITNARGSNVIMAEDQDQYTIYEHKHESANLDNLDLNRPDLAPQINFFSSSPHQMSYEYQDKNNISYGLFSYAFCRSLHELTKEDNYKSLWEKISLFISQETSLQSPYVEGRINEKIFGKIMIAPTSYFTLKKILAPDLLILGAGAIHGITEGSIVGIYDIKDENYKKPLATAYVDGVDAFTSDLSLDKKWKNKNLSNYKVKVINAQLSELKVNVNLEAASSIERRLTKRLSENPIIVFDSKKFDLILKAIKSTKDSLHFQLLTSEGNLLYQEFCTSNKFFEEEILDMIEDKISNYARAKNLKALETPDNYFGASIELLALDSTHEFKKPETLVFNTNQRVKIHISNKGKEGFYFALFDINPESAINKIFPEKNGNALEYYIKPGTSFLSDSFAIEPPLGTEVLKLVCSKEPIDFGLVRGNAKQSKNPIQNLINTLTTPGLVTRGLKPSLSTEQGYIGSYTFMIR